MSVARQTEHAANDVEIAQQLLDLCGGDALMALRSVIADAEFLCEQLETARLYLSPGMARGWTPKFTRDR